MTPDIAIRFMTSADMDANMALHRTMVEESGHNGAPIFTPMEAWDEERANRNRDNFTPKFSIPIGSPGWCRIFGLFIDGALCGELSLRGGELPTDQHRTILGISIAKSSRGQGLGRRMMDHAIAWAVQETTLDWVDLYVFDNNTKAQQLYRQAGFVEVGRTADRFRVFNTQIDDIHMVLDLQTLRNTQR